MTRAHLYDPLEPAYYDPADARAERDRTFQICSDCRICVRFCPSFKDLFKFVDARDVAHDVKDLSDEEHAVVVDECYQCKLCYVVCPYVPEREQEWKIDFPRLMLRSAAIRSRERGVPRNAKLLARTDLQGRTATSLAGIVNRSSNVTFLRKAMEKVTGISAERLLPSYAHERFSKWFRRRSPAPDTTTTVALFPTCLVEYQDPGIGKAAVGVLERNGIGCDLPEGQVCCGMPWLDAGDTERFVDNARRNVEALLPAARAGRPILVPQPTCAYVLKNEVPDFVGTDEARLVAEHTFDVSEWLVNRHRAEAIDTDFAGETYETIIWHHACHYRAQQMGPKSRDLMALTGAKVEMVDRCAGIDGTWGLRAENVEMSKRIAKPLVEKVTASEADLVVGDCHLANTAILEQSGKRPVHPVQVLARAYGIDDGTAEGS
jgi:glycerol-3-phosphate dehydrogenase subunit C